MKALWELPGGIARIVNALLGRLSKLEGDVLSQEKRLLRMQEKADSTIHTMELREVEAREQEELRQDRLDDNQLREELKRKYGTTKWAKGFINSLILGRRKDNEIKH